MFLVLPAKPHTEPLLQGVVQLLVVVIIRVVSNFGAQQDAVLLYGLFHPRLQKSLYPPPYHRASSLKVKRFESKLASEACYFGRDLGITKIIHEHNITEAVHGEKGSGSSNHQHLNVLPSHHCIILRNVTCHSQIQSVAKRGSIW